MGNATKKIDVVFTRRQFLGSLAAASLPLFVSVSACERHRYIRPAGELDLGTVRELLYSVVHVPRKSALVYRDEDGWRALSTRCTYNGCDLTYQVPILLCPCCRSEFDLTGHALKGGKATHDLPWMEITYREGHLFADPGHMVAETNHFSTPEIEAAIHSLRERIKDEVITDQVKIPEVLMGHADGEPGRQFLEDDPELIHQLQMIK